MAEISQSRIASIPTGQRTNNIAHTSLPARAACAAKPAQRDLCAGCSNGQLPSRGSALSPDGQGAIPTGPPGTPGTSYSWTGEVELQVLGAEPAAGTVYCAAGCSGMGHSTAPPRSPRHAAEPGGAERKGLAAAPGPAAPGEYFIFSVQ